MHGTFRRDLPHPYKRGECPLPDQVFYGYHAQSAPCHKCNKSGSYSAPGATEHQSTLKAAKQHRSLVLAEKTA